MLERVKNGGTNQLQMGLTELAPGSVWNTMPAHTHTRRMEAYFYFNLPEGNAICHLMGEPQEERLVWLHNEQAITSGMVYPRRCRYQQLYLYLGYGR